MLPLVNGPRHDLGATRPLDLIRHGSTKLNSEKGGDKIRGWADIPLDDRGREEAKKMGQKLCDAKRRPDILVSSDLSRARETAHIISRACGIPVAGSTPVLRPWNLGHMQGKESAVVVPEIIKYIHSPDTPVPGGESFNQFKNRFLSGLKELLHKFPHRVAIVSHHRNERVLVALDKADWNGFDFKEFARRGDPPGSLVTFNIPTTWLQ